MSFDAWGKRREPATAAFYAAGFTPSFTTPRGFTGHEHIDEVGLVNMNARVYDPELGRFLQPDVFVQDDKASATLNRYTYVANNPLSYTDPSGHFLKGLFKSIGKFFTKLWRTFKDVFITAGIEQLLNFIPGIGPFAAALATAINVGINGGDIGDMFKAVVFRNITSGIANALNKLLPTVDIAKQLAFADKVGELAPTYSSLKAGLASINYGNVAKKVVIQGTVGGILAEISGSKFSKGFAYAATAQLARDVYSAFEPFREGLGPGEGVEEKKFNDGSEYSHFEGRNHIGKHLIKGVDSEPAGSEGGLLSQVLNRIPGINATAAFHDGLQLVIRGPNGGGSNTFINFGTMVPSAIITYSAYANEYGGLYYQVANDRKIGTPVVNLGTPIPANDNFSFCHSGSAIGCGTYGRWE